jgi:hypothetical protein
LGKNHTRETNISSIYQYSDTLGNQLTIPENALDGKYSDSRFDCAGSIVQQPVPEAWWQVTLKSISKIFKVNLVFRNDGE